MISASAHVPWIDITLLNSACMLHACCMNMHAVLFACMYAVLFACMQIVLACMQKVFACMQQGAAHMQGCMQFQSLPELGMQWSPAWWKLCMHSSIFMHALPFPCMHVSFLCMHPLHVCMNMHANVPNYMHDSCMQCMQAAGMMQVWSACMTLAQFRRALTYAYGVSLMIVTVLLPLLSVCSRGSISSSIGFPICFPFRCLRFLSLPILIPHWANYWNEK